MRSKVEEQPFSGLQMVRGGAWTVGAFAATGIVKLASSMTLTRIIPDAASAYGAMTIVYTYFTGINLFSDFGIGQVIVQHKRGMDPEFRRTAFSVQSIRGVLVCLAAYALAPVFAAAYPEHPELTELLSVMALCGVISGLSSTSMFAFKRNMEVVTLAKISFASQLAGTCATIAHALVSPSPWAMVTGSLVSTAFTTLTSHIFGDKRDSFGWDKTARREMLTIGRWVFLSTALSFCSNQSERLIFGKLLSARDLGIYAIAIVLPTQLTNLIQHLTHSVAFPALCREARSGRHTDANYALYARPIAAVGALLLTPLCGAGDSVMRILYPPEIAQGGWMLQLTALGVWPGHALGAPRGTALLAMGMPKYIAASNFTKLVSMCCLIPLGFYLAGFAGALSAYAASNGVKYLANVACCRAIGIGALRNDAIWTSKFLASALAVYAMNQWLGSCGVSDMLRCIAAGAATMTIWLPVTISSIRGLHTEGSK